MKSKLRTLPPVSLHGVVLNPNVIEALFARTNFGGAEKTEIGRRGLMVDCVLKLAAGYSDGYTILTICKDAGLILESARPSKAGMRWAFEQLYQPGGRPTILERIQNPRGLLPSRLGDGKEHPVIGGPNE